MGRPPTRPTSPRCAPGSAEPDATPDGTGAAPLRRHIACGAILLLYGGLLAGLYILHWTGLERPLSEDALLATALFAAAGGLAAFLARLAAGLLARRPPSVRFAATLIMLAVVPPLVLSLVMAVRTLLRFHDFEEIPPHIAGLIVAILGGGSLYGLLSTAMRSMAPFVLPLMLLFAWLIALAPPCAGGGRSAKAHPETPKEPAA